MAKVVSDPLDQQAVLHLAEVEQHLDTFGLAGLAHSLKTAWSETTWSALSADSVTADVPASALRFLSCHRDGRIREAAVRHLDERPDNLRWLLLRANDWHLPLARLAAQKACEILSAANSHSWLCYLDLLYGFTRPSAHRIRLEIEQICVWHPESFEAFVARPEMPPASRRLAWQLLFETHPTRALEAARNNDDVTLRARALKNVPAEQLASYLDDPVPFLRRDAIHRLANEDLLSPDLLYRGLLDKAYSVREVSKFYAKKLGRQNLMETVYRQSPLSAARLQGAVGILPLAELEPLLLNSLDNPDPSIWKAAMEAIDKALRDPEPLWWEMVRHHRDPGKRRRAGRLLRNRRSFYFTGEVLWQAQEQAPAPQSQELLGWAEISHCPYTRLQALFQKVKSYPDSLTPKEFAHRLNGIKKALPAYAIPSSQLSKLRQIKSAWRTDWLASLESQWGEL